MSLCYLLFIVNGVFLLGILLGCFVFRNEIRTATKMATALLGSPKVQKVNSVGISPSKEGLPPLPSSSRTSTSDKVGKIKFRPKR